MTNQELLITIADYSRVELTTPHLEEMAEELRGINLLQFKNFVKASLDRAELQYTPKGLERFMKFVSLYNKEVNSAREQKAQKQSQLLEEKFRKVKPQLKAEHYKGLYPKLEELKADNSNYFTKFEIEQLNAIGQPKYLVMLSDTFKLQEAIEKTYLKVIYNKPQVAVTNNRDISKALEVKRI